MLDCQYYIRKHSQYVHAICRGEIRDQGDVPTVQPANGDVLQEHLGQGVREHPQGAQLRGGPAGEGG